MSDLPTSDSVVICYIGGEGRSGSTILSALLGNHEGFFPIGEFQDVWKAVKTDQLCGCGQSFSSCVFWRCVGEQGFGGWDRVDVERMLKMDSQFARHRRIPRLLVSSLRSVESTDLNQYRRVLARLYATVKEVSGCSVIVDSTKSPAYALLLQKAPGLDLRFVHLVRDSRGVAYSRSKKQVERPEYGQHPVLKDTYMKSSNSIKAALDWDVKNVLFKFSYRSDRCLVIKYESVMSEPALEVAGILRFIDESHTDSSETEQPRREFEFLPFHTLGGNRVRFERGRISLRVDEEWKSNMRLSQRLVVGALTLPLLMAYGYVSPSARLKHQLERDSLA